MIALKCKMCGGNIILTGERHGVCENCRTEVTLPAIDDDKRIDMYNRGNHFRQIGDFERAYSAYEHIIADDREDAEAHWCLTLCRYGVEYVKDPVTEEYKPTVSRMSYESILDDPDFKDALRCSDEYTRQIYFREAEKIYGIQQRFMQISVKEQPYEVFICFKAEEEDRQRTIASEKAQEIYEKLTSKGVRVFFSRITLENKLGEEYEPYIFAALNSAKVMLLAADKPEQLQARWVRNEWSRYLGMMQKDKNKTLIPVFVNMSPYDFPPEIPASIQGVDLSRVGAMQDLVRGVCKLTGHLAEGAQMIAGEASAGKLLIRVRQAMEDADYKEAERLLEEVLNRSPENGEAFYFRLLCSHRRAFLPSGHLTKEEQEWVNDRNFKRALQYGSEERKTQLLAFQEKSWQAGELGKVQAYLQEKNVESAEKHLKEFEQKITAAGKTIDDRTFFERLQKQIPETALMVELEEIEKSKKSEHEMLNLVQECLDKKDPKKARAILTALICGNSVTDKPLYEEERYHDLCEKTEELEKALEQAERLQQEAMQAAARQRQEFEQNLQRYKTEIGDPNTYIKRTLEQKHPKEMTKYAKLKKQNSSKTGKPRKSGTVVFPMLVSIIMLLCSCGMYGIALYYEGYARYHNARTLPPLIALGRSIAVIMESSGSGFIKICFYLLFAVFLAGWVLVPVVVLLKMISVGVISGIVSAFLLASILFSSANDMTEEMVARLFYYLIFASALYVLFTLYHLIKCMREKRAVKALQEYTEKVMLPLEAEEQKLVMDTWQPLIGQDNMMKLAGFLESQGNQKLAKV